MGIKQLLLMQTGVPFLRTRFVTCGTNFPHSASQETAYLVVWLARKTAKRPLLASSHSSKEEAHNCWK